MDDESSLMTTEVMLARMRDFSTIGVSQTAGLIMGGVFATAAVTFTEILRMQDALPVRLTGWLFGVVASLIVLDGLIRRALIEARPILRAVPMVAMAGLLSMLAFALLGPQTGGADGWRYMHLLVVAVGVFLTATFDEDIADHVEPALRPLYAGFATRSQGRRRSLWAMTLLGAVPFGLAMADKYGRVSLQWPIAVVNLLLCGLYIFSLIRSHRYYESLYAEACAAHLEKLRLGPASHSPQVPFRRARRKSPGA